MIDWNKFAERVPAGTMVKAYYGNEGIMLENKPYSQTESRSVWRARLQKAELFHAKLLDYLDEEPDTILYQPFLDSHIDGRILSPITTTFLINGEWKTFNEVMA